MVSGESHYVRGRKYTLAVVQKKGAAAVRIRNSRILELQVRPGTGREKREEILYNWYRGLLREQIPKLITKWEPRIGVTVAECRIKKMKTRWGTCNIEAGRIWLNLELAKKPPSCTEYIFVHEMVHFLERHHNDQFKEYMDRYLPQWRMLRDNLNESALGAEDWNY